MLQSVLRVFFKCFKEVQGSLFLATNTQIVSRKFQGRFWTKVFLNKSILRPKIFVQFFKPRFLDQHFYHNILGQNLFTNF